MEREAAAERERFEQSQEEAQSQAHALEEQLNESYASAAEQLARVLLTPLNTLYHQVNAYAWDLAYSEM